ncbi:RNA-directed DNA polymerase, eukaryota, reverse transcriptase zinc-binding domain protein [Tanacetum coccineum]
MQQLDLEAEVSNEEIKKTVWDYGVDKSLRPDGFTFGFYKRFWSLIEKDVLAAIGVQAANRIGCGVLKAPFAYLGSKVGGNMSRIKSWDEIVDKMVDRANESPLRKKGGLGVSSLYALNRALMCKWVWRFTTQKNLLWTRVIKAIHGEDGKNGSGFKRIVAWRHGFETKNPRLNALEVNKTVDWLLKLSQENLTWWYWTLDGSGEFSVASARKVIDDNRFSEVSTQTRWIKAVPIKVNIHAWKVRMDCLPTRLNISRRGIDIPSILCPVCGSVTESSV